MSNPLTTFAPPESDEKEHDEKAQSHGKEEHDESHEGDDQKHDDGHSHDDDHKHDDGHSHDDSHDHSHDEHDGHHEQRASVEEWQDSEGKMAMDWYLSADHLISHVQDQTYFEMPRLTGELAFKEPAHIGLPNPLGFTADEPVPLISGSKENPFLGPSTFQPTKFIYLELVAAILVAGVFVMLGQKMKSGKAVKGRFWNMLEAGCVYVRDEIARPSIGTKDADRFLPFLWSVFFFVLAMNLIGLIPGLGSATGSISITASLALVVFAVVVMTGAKKMGAAGFIKAQAPHIDIDGFLAPLKYLLVPLIWAIEMFGLLIKHVVLAVRLFANMFAGHLVLAVFIAFIGVVWGTALSWGVVPGVIGASLGVYILELLVAFIQAYVFTFLTALFIGAAIHPH